MACFGENIERHVIFFFKPIGDFGHFWQVGDKIAWPILELPFVFCNIMLGNLAATFLLLILDHVFTI
jgi:hypothetical protein